MEQLKDYRLDPPEDEVMTVRCDCGCEEEAFVVGDKGNKEYWFVDADGKEWEMCEQCRADRKMDEAERLEEK